MDVRLLCSTLPCSTLPPAVIPGSCAPAQALVGGLLMQRHGVHELQARALVGAPQQRAAVAVDQPHPLQRAEEPLPDLLLLMSFEGAVSTGATVLSD